MARRIGIYSGTFDPVHGGHVAFALAALKTCGLSEVVFLPEERPRGKQNVTALSHRTALLEKAIQTHPNLHIAKVSSPQFTVAQTLPELQKRFPSAELTLLVGSDVARGISYWPDADMLFKEVHLAIGMRSGDSKAEIGANLPAGTTFVETNFAMVASSQIRRGEAAHFNQEIARYVDAHALYAPSERSYAS